MKMSGYANTNYGPPPMGQTNLVNGLPATQQQQQTAQGVAGAPPSPFSANHQQQIQQQQQQILQQKQPQQQQLLSQPVPTLQSNMSKFLPPTSNSASSAALNGPTRPPSATAQAAASNLPPHMRPPGMNGPQGAMPLTNGGGGSGDLSTNSSRTASPSLAQQAQFGGYNAKPPLSQAPSGNVTASNPQYSSASATALSGSMQNLSINRTNGAAPANMPPPTNMQQQLQPSLPPNQTQQQQTPFPSNYQANFRTNAMNAPTPLSAQPPTSQANVPPPHSTAPYAGGKPLQPPTPYTNTSFSQTTPTQTLNSTAGAQPQPPTSQLPASSAAMFGTSRSQPILANAPPSAHPQPPQAATLTNANYAPSTAIGGMQSPLPPTSAAATALQQNQLNNNTQQQTSTLRKPMYPSGPPPTLATTPQQQPQQPYAPVYQPQPGLFNGQPSTAPLQYQSQPYMQQPQPVHQQQFPQPQQQHHQQQQQQNFPIPSGGAYNQQMSVTQAGFSRLWGQDTIDLTQNRHILSPATVTPPRIVLNNQFHESINCNPNIMRSTIAKIPESNALLQKSRLPLGILIHPFRDINSLPVIQCPNIVRCRLCRTYINPFVYFVDSKMWKCNLCYRVNELPEDFQYDPATKTYGDVMRRPEVRSSTIEFIAPSEYMLRPPQPAIYLFLFDVSIIAQQSGYLENICATLSKHLDDMPGDARTQIGFIAYNSHVHFYSMAEGYNQPHELTLLDIDDPFLPRPDNLLVNLKECKELVKDLLTQLPKRFADTHDPGSALGSALQVAYKLMQASGGRVTVFQTCLPNKGPGSLEPREDPNNRSAKDVAHLNPATDFYKRFALECSGYQIAVDLFLLNQQYSDMATISGISKYSGGCVHHFPLYQKTKPQIVDSVRQCFKRYLVRKIGFEAVMRIRCTRGLQVHTFHGNFFVRSTDLLSLPNVNPDAGYGMQISYEESLSEAKTVCFQAALLYTNSEGERRIRVHTMCLPVTGSLPEVMHAADTEAIIGLLSKMAVDRSLTSNVADAREAFINATVDIFNAFKIAQNLPSGQSGQLIAPRSLALMPLYISALLKHPAFRVGTSTRLDDRVYAMDCMKTLPLDQLMKFIYPEFYLIDALFYPNANALEDDEEEDLPELPRLQLSAEFLDSRSIFLLDCGNLIIIYVGLNVPVNVLEGVFGVKATAELPDYLYGLPNVTSPANDILKRFILRLNDDKPYPPMVQIIRDTSTAKPQFIEKLVDDRSESSLSYYEFLQHIRTQVK
ncbi:protein transport protein Sec24A [Bactrocera neohumeralis]|uniref:protein transport protein Sec24A n=1 Tax=Bactrocera neohumeralis TaxID=98809 RepID=UPI00216527F9|nr:protein transport protein Sec24A [Bactrocera neohumeralis]XP_050322831.1 protein transport protein Sec24A [Bactrocera neohumeralis]